MTNNGTLDTRLNQNLVHTYRIPCNVEYTKLKPFKIGGGNGIYIAHRPSGVKVWFATENNFESRKRLDSENRGVQYREIGSEGLNKLYDNFYIYTEGTSADEVLEIEVTSAESSITPLLGNASGRIDEVESIGGLSQNAINDIIRANLGGLSTKNKLFQKQILINGGFTFSNTFNAQGMRLYHFPLGRDTKISDLKLDNNKLYRIRTMGHFDIGQKNLDNVGTANYTAKTANRIQKTYSDRTSAMGDINAYVTFNLINNNVNIKIIGVGVQDKTQNVFVDDTINFTNITTKQSKTALQNNCNNYKTFVAQDYDSQGVYDYYFSIDIMPIWNVVESGSSSVSSAYYDITESAHLSLIKEIASPIYSEVNNNISTTFSNLYTSAIQNSFSDFNIWGFKARHSNYKSVIVNYEGVGLNVNSFDMVMSGKTINSFDELLLGFNVSNIYNYDENITKSAANCHSSLIMEISEVG